MARAKIYDYLDRLGIRPDYSAYNPDEVDIEAGKAGYEQYLAQSAHPSPDMSQRVDQLGSKAAAWYEWQQKPLGERLKDRFLDFTDKLGITGNDELFVSDRVPDLPLNELLQGKIKLKDFNQTQKDFAKEVGAQIYSRPQNDWTDEEKWAFGELYGQGKVQEAYDLAEKINAYHAVDERTKKSEKLAEWSGKNLGTAVLGSGASLLLNTAAGGIGYLDALREKAVYGRTYEDDFLAPHEVANAFQSGVAERLNDLGTLNEKIPVVGGKGLGDVYGIGMSVGQTAMLSPTGLGGTLAAYFGMAASNGYTEAKARGATDEQAFAFGTVSALAESIPEMISMKSLLNIASSEAAESLLKNVLKQAGQEAGEELTTSVISEIADRWIMGGKSNYQILVNNLVAQGMSEAEAEKAAFKYTFNNIAYDAFAGGISGTVSGAGAIGANKIYQKYLNDEANTKAKETLTPQISSIIEEGKKYESTKKKAESIEKKVSEGQELTGYELRTFTSKVAEAMNNSEVNAVRQAIVQQMQEGGLSESKAKSLGEIALNKTLGNDVSKLQDLLLKNNEVATQVYNQTTEQVINSGVGDSDWIANTPLAKIREERKKLNEKRVSQPGENDKEKLDQIKEELAAVYGKNTKEYKINMASVEGKFEQTGDKVTYTKKSADSKIHTEGITSSLTHKDISELAAIEELANALGIDIYVYETKLDSKTGERIYVDSNGNRYSDSGFYDPNNNTVHIDLHAGQNGEGTMRYTASHEAVHFVKENAAEHFDALEKLVTKALVKGGYSMEKLIEAQRKKAEENGQKLTEEQLREEVVAEACQSFLASKNAAAEIRALKSENRGLWDVLKRFFISLFNKLSTIYKGVDPDSVEGKYIADMRKAVKPIRDAFMEGVAQASKNVEAKKKASANTTTEVQTTFEKNYQKSKDVRKNARYVNEHRATLEKLGDESTTVPMNDLLKRYDKLVEIWDNLGGELSSEFLDQWNNKQGKDRAFTVFKAQAGYKYNVELSSMCKKGIPLFEAIDTIVRSEVVDQLKSKTIAKAEKEILYELLKEKSFDIPCAICYVEQARQREGEIINSFLDGKVEKTPAGKTKTYKIGWNETFKALEKEMKSQGVNYTFPEVGRDIATDKYTKAELPAMDAKTEKAFYDSLLKLINKEISRYNSEKDPKAKSRLTLRSVTPAEIKRCLGGTLPANLKLYKTIAMNPDSRFRINNDLLYSSATTTNLASFHNDLYSLFNMQGGVSGYKLKQGTVVYWGDILSKKWDSSKLRKEGGVRNQSNSDFMMYTLLDQAQMYIDFTAKGYYLQAYTKVISELKLFGLSKGKINASLIPRVEIYRKDNGFEVDIEKTRDNAGLDKNGNPIYDDIEGIPHEEAFMLIEDADYSKNIGGICIGYSDKHISKLLDDARIQLIIGYHDKTDDPDKRYYGARYAKNYNGENEARVKNADGTFTTKHVGFNQFVIAAEKLFKKGVDSVDYNGNTYKYDDIPKLAADMYLKMCQDKNYIPAYDQFSSHENYYKLLADFSLYDSEGHYAPHQKVAYNMPDVVPYLDENGNKEYMPTKDYIKKELKKELTVRDDISAALSDHTENGIIPKFVKQANQLYESQNIRHKARGVDKYTLKEYNNYGWARANDVLSAKENAKLRSLFADAVTKQSNPPITKSGEYMIAIGEDVDNKIAYMEGTIDDPKITKVLAIDEYDETQLDKARRNIYDLERRGIQQKTQGVFRLYREADFGSYADFARNVERDKQNYLQLGADRGAGSRTTPKIKEILFDEEGNEVSRIVRSKARTSYTAGQMAKMKANLSQQKVYSKVDTMKLVKELAPGIRKRSFDMLTKKLWKGFNTYVTGADRRVFANDMADMFIDRMLVDTLQKHKDWDEASEKLMYLKQGIGRIKFRPEDISEIEYMLDSKGLRHMRARWGYKSVKQSDPNTTPKVAYSVDTFVKDLSREMPGMEHLADMHIAEALVEVDKLYDQLSEMVKDKYESAYEDFSDEWIAEIRSGIVTDILKAYETYGEQSALSKYLVERFKYYTDRIDYWKAEHAKVKTISRWNGILSTKAMHIRELKKGAFYNATQYHPDIFKDSIEKLSQIQWRGNISPKKIREIFAELKKWYTANNPMLFSKDAQDNLFSETIAAYIDNIADTKKGAFDANTYAMVYDVMNHLYTMMRNYNKVFRNNRWQDAPDLAKDYLDIMNQNKRKRNAFTRAQDIYNKNVLEPMAVAKQADGYNPNGFFTQTMEELRQASINASVGEMNLRKKYDEFIDSNKKYLTDAAKSTVKYRGYDVPKLNLIGLYLTMKRKHSRAGLALEGFELSVKTKWWDSEDRVYIPGYLGSDGEVTQDIIDAATATQMSEIEKTFTETDKQYIKVIESLFNEDLKNLKVERDMERQGYTNATVDYYYPIIRGAMAENIDTSRISNDNRATNASFNKNTVKGSKQRLVIISADAMVNRHITDMCKYYYMSQAIENYNVLYNCDISGNPNNPINIATFVKDSKVWDKDFEYFRKLINDMQGIREPMTDIEKAIESLRGNYAKFALGLNAKVLATQLSSMISAGNVIGFNKIFSPQTLKISTADVETYCPLAAVRSYEKTALRAMSLTDKVGKVSEALSIGISVMDKLVIQRLYASCQLEAQSRGDGDLGTEENKISAGKILEQIIIETQQNSYATERSAAMRSKNALLKSLTMFTADGIKVFSRIHEAAGELTVAKKNGDKQALAKAKKKLAKSIAVATAVAAYLSGLAMVFNWIYDRDEDEDENKLVTFALGTVGNFIGALPGISDLYDFIVNGFEIEDATFDTINNLVIATGNLYKDVSSMVSRDGERSIEDLNRDLRSMLYGVGQVSGIPFRNVYNLVRGVVGNVSSKAGYSIDAKFYETSLASDFEKAIEDGDGRLSDYITGLIYGERVNSSVSEAQRSEIIRLSMLDYHVLPKSIPEKISRNNQEYELTESQHQVLTEEYSKVVEAIDHLISSAFYANQTDEDKAYLIDYYHDKYYDLAVNKALNLEDKNAAVYKAINFDTYAMISFMIKDIESDKDKDGNTISGSKKKKIIDVLKKIKMSEEKKLFFLASRGYSLTELQDKKLCAYLNSLKVSASIKEQLAEMCGYSYKNGRIVYK